MSNNEALQEFHADLFQDIVATSEAEQIYKEEALFEVFTEYLIDAGEFDDAIYAHYEKDKGGIRVDGYCGDPLDDAVSRVANSGNLCLIAVDFNPGASLKTITQTEIKAAFKRVANFLVKSKDPKFRMGLEETSPGYELASIISMRWGMISKVKIYLLTNRALSNKITGMDSDEIDGLSVSYDVWDVTRLFRLVDSGREREPLIVDFNELPGGPLKALRASSTDHGSKAVYLAAIPGVDLATIYDRWGTRLLEQNVRVFLQAKSKVNKGIRSTLENEPELFFSFNNGLTATAEKIETVNTEDGPAIARLENFQIVNGGQTTASIYAAYKNKVNLGRVFVQMKLSIVSPENAKELVPRISRSANSQNKVSDADFFSNHPYHVLIEKMSRKMLAPAAEGSFLETRWYYERARGQYRDDQAYLTGAQKRKFAQTNPKSQVFSKTDLAKYLMVWTADAYYVNRGAQKNFAKFAEMISAQWEQDELQFNEYYFKSLVAKKIIFNSTERIVASQPWYEAGGYRSQHVVLAIAHLAYSIEKMGKSLNFEKIWNEQAVSPLLADAIAISAEIAHKTLMSPLPGYNNISEWAKQAKCLAELNKQTAAWSEEWLSELVDKSDVAEARAEAKREQREINGIEALEQVVSAGSKFWVDVLSWGIAHNALSEKEQGILRAACRVDEGKLPSDKQSVFLVKMMARLKEIGCPHKLGRTKTRRARRH